MMWMKKSRSSLLSPGSLAIHVIGIGAAVLVGKAWGRKSDDF